MQTDESRESQRSNGWNFPAHHKVYVPQIRSVRIHSKARCTMCSCIEHFEWENLHFLVVLVDFAGRFVGMCHHLFGLGCDATNHSWSNHQTTIPKWHDQWSWGAHQQYSGKGSEIESNFAQLNELFVILSSFARFFICRLETFCCFICSAKISVWMHFRRSYVSYAIVWAHRPHRHRRPWKCHTKWHHSTVRHSKMKRRRWHSCQPQWRISVNNKLSQFLETPVLNLVSL